MTHRHSTAAQQVKKIEGSTRAKTFFALYISPTEKTIDIDGYNPALALCLLFAAAVLSAMGTMWVPVGQGTAAALAEHPSMQGCSHGGVWTKRFWRRGNWAHKFNAVSRPLKSSNFYRTMQENVFVPLDVSGLSVGEQPALIPIGCQGTHSGLIAVSHVVSPTERRGPVWFCWWGEEHNLDQFGIEWNAYFGIGFFVGFFLLFKFKCRQNISQWNIFRLNQQIVQQKKPVPLPFFQQVN